MICVISVYYLYFDQRISAEAWWQKGDSDGLLSVGHRDWFNTASVWMQSKVSSAIISNLYDLNDLHFDLSPRGYDLDNAWPSFARQV